MKASTMKRINGKIWAQRKNLLCLMMIADALGCNTITIRDSAPDLPLTL